MSFYAKHVFFCCNQRDGGDRPSCNAKGASRLRDYAKGRIKKLGLAGEGKIRINQAGCLDRCEEGPCVVVYPDAVWYTYVDESDIDEQEDNSLSIKEGQLGPRWRVKALTEIEQFNEEIGADLPEDDVDTIGGLVASHLGRMPHKGEVFDLENLRFEVLRADARQIHVLLVEKLPLPEDDHD